MMHGPIYIRFSKFNSGKIQSSEDNIRSINSHFILNSHRAASNRNSCHTISVKNCRQYINPLALELDIYSLAHHLCKMLIFNEPRRVTLGNARHFVEE